MLSLPMSPLIGYMVLNDVTLQNLQETYRGPMIEALRKAVESLNVKTIKLEQEALKAMKEEGLVIHEPPADAQEKWRAAPIRGMEDVAGKAYPKEILDEVLALLREFRAKHSRFSFRPMSLITVAPGG